MKKNGIFYMKWPAVLFIFLTIILSIVLFNFFDLTPHVDQNFFFATEDPQLKEDNLITQIFPDNTSQILLGVKGGIDTPQYFQSIKTLSEKILNIEEVSAVKSISHGPGTFKKAMESPFWKRLLISEDVKSTLIMVFLRNAKFSETIPKIERIQAQFENPQFQIKISGFPYIVDKINRYLTKDLKIFSLTSFLIFSIGILIIFRSLNVLLGTMTACVFACISTMIISQLVGIKIGILTANLSTIVFVLTLSQIVFLTFNWQTICRNKSASDADYVKKTLRLTFSASFWCMATTLLGFLSLLNVSAKPLRELGISGAIGTFMSIIMAYTVYPFFLVKTNNHHEEDESSSSSKSKIFHFIKTYNFRIFLVIISAGIFLSFNLKNIDTDPSLLSYFSSKSDLYEGLTYIDKNGGSSPLKVVIKDAKNQKLITSKIYTRLWQLQKNLEDDPSVGAVISFPLIMAEGKRAPFAFFMSWEWLLEIMGRPKYERITNQFITEDRKYCYFLLRMNELNRKSSRLEIVESLKRIIESHGFIAEKIGGTYNLQGHLSSLIRSSLIFGLGQLILIFVIISYIVSRTVKTTIAMTLGLCLIPIYIIGTAGLLKVPFDIISAPAANVAIGMGIDSMIHLVTRVRYFRKKGLNQKMIWQKAKGELWQPIIGSMVIICAGFGIFGLSSFPPTQRFGFFIILGAVVATLISLFVVPSISKLKIDL